jgi:hypothetical protein
MYSLLLVLVCIVYCLSQSLAISPSLRGVGGVNQRYPLPSPPLEGGGVQGLVVNFRDSYHPLLILTSLLRSSAGVWPGSPAPSAELRRHWRGWLSQHGLPDRTVSPLNPSGKRRYCGPVSKRPSFYPLTKQFSILLHLYSNGLLQFIGPTAMILFVFLFLSGLFYPDRRPPTMTAETKQRKTSDSRQPHYYSFILHAKHSLCASSRPPPLDTPPPDRLLHFAAGTGF